MFDHSNHQRHPRRARRKIQFWFGAALVLIALAVIIGMLLLMNHPAGARP